MNEDGAQIVGKAIGRCAVSPIRPQTTSDTQQTCPPVGQQVAGWSWKPGQAEAAAADTCGVSARLIALRYPSSCRVCEKHLPAKSMAYHDRPSKTVTCQSCEPDATPDSPNELVPTAPELLVGSPGARPQHEYERRAARREARLEQTWGRLARVARFFSEEPPHTTAFRKGADGERRLAAHLEREVGDRAIFLHSRRIRNGDIDHVAIAASGIFVIDAKNYNGRVEARDVGNWRTIDRRLFVGNRDKSKLVEGMDKQVRAVRAALEPAGLNDTPVLAVLCFTDSDWGFFAKPLVFDDVTCLWAERLCELIGRPGPLDESQRTKIGHLLSASLPPTM